MTTRCDPNEAIPKTCADAFLKQAVDTAEIKTDVKALVEQTTRINGSITELFERTNQSATERAENRIKVKALEVAAALAGSRTWQIVLMILTLVAGILIGAVGKK